MKRVAIYIRVSTTQQSEEGLSLHTQLSNCSDYARLRGFTLPACIYMDSGISGGSVKNRPAMTQLLKDIEDKRIQVMVITKLDRAWRSVKDALDSLERIKKAGAALVILELNIDTSTASGEMIFSLMAAFGRFEAQQTGERIHATNKRLVLDGRHTGGHKPPTGYVRNADTKQLEVDDKPLGPGLLSPAAIVRRIYADYLLDRMGGATRIAVSLNKEGYRTPEGRRWVSGAVLRILRNPVYKGELVYGKDASHFNKNFGKEDREGWVRAPGSHPPLVSASDWAAAQAKMMKRRTPGRDTTLTRLYSGLLYCGECGERLYATTGGSDRRAGRNRPPEKLYRCARAMGGDREGCPRSRSIYERILDGMVTPALLANLDRVKAGDFNLRKTPKSGPAKRDQEWEREQIRNKIRRLNRVFIDGGFEGEEEAYHREKREAEGRLTALDGEKPAPSPLSFSPALLDAVRTILESDEVEFGEKRGVVGDYIERILVYRESVTVHYKAYPYTGWRTEEELRREQPHEASQRAKREKKAGL